MSGSKESLWNSGTALALLTASFYGISTAHYGGFLGVLRLDADVLDRNFHQILFHGFLTAYVPAFHVLAFGSLFLLAMAVLVTPAMNAYLNGKRSRKRNFLLVKQFLTLGGRATPLERKLRRLAKSAFICLTVAVSAIYLLAHFERRGRTAAEELLGKLKGPMAESALVSVRIDGEQHRLLYLTCGARNCAGMDPTTHMVYYFPQNGHAFRHPASEATVPPEQTRQSESTREVPNR